MNVPMRPHAHNPRKLCMQRWVPFNRFPFEEMALLHVCNLKLILLHALALLKPTGRSTCRTVVGSCLCPKICVWRMYIACAAHMQLIFACVALMCAVTAVGAKVRTAVVRFDLFGLVCISPLLQALILPGGVLVGP